VSPAQAAALAAGVRSMTREQLEYKGLTECGAELLGWLDARARVDG
jgi:hypothetical protein